MNKNQVLIFICVISLMVSTAGVFAEDNNPLLIPNTSRALRVLDEDFLSHRQLIPNEEQPAAAQIYLDAIRDSGLTLPDDHLSLFQSEFARPESGFHWNNQLNLYFASNGDPDTYNTYSVREFNYDEDADSASVPTDNTGGALDTWIETHFSNGGGTQTYTDYRSMYQSLDIPSFFVLGFDFISGNWAMSSNIDIRGSIPYYMKSKSSGQNFTNVPLNPGALDINIPYKGVTSYFGEHVDFRIGRDKLHVGPGQNSTLTLSQYMPYFDYARAALRSKRFSYSSYFIRLNPTITEGEAEYFQYMYDNWDDEHLLEQNNYLVPRIFDQSKHFIMSKMVYNPTKWFRFSFTQCHLIGGRVPQLVDFNPLMIFHNLYEDGQYGVPITLGVTVSPVKGVKVYGETEIYDIQAWNENEQTTNPSAIAFQGGFTLLSQPYFSVGPGRFRLDGEFSYAMPWIYGKYMSYRQMTSRFITTNPGFGRKYIDVPLGFYMGPDALEFYTKLSYGDPSKWEAILSYELRGKGAIFMYGYGEENATANANDYEQKGLLTRRIDGTADIEWENTIKIHGTKYFKTSFGDMSTEAWAGISMYKNRLNQPGKNQTFGNVGVSTNLKL